MDRADEFLSLVSAKRDSRHGELGNTMVNHTHEITVSMEMLIGRHDFESPNHVHHISYSWMVSGVWHFPPASTREKAEENVSGGMD